MHRSAAIVPQRPYPSKSRDASVTRRRRAEDRYSLTLSGEVLVTASVITGIHAQGKRVLLRAGTREGSLSFPSSANAAQAALALREFAGRLLLADGVACLPLDSAQTSTGEERRG